MRYICVCVCVCIYIYTHTHLCVSAQLCLTLRPHGLQPTRLLCPQASLGKNTGVGCHFFLQRIFLTQESNPHLCVSCIDTGFLYHCATREGCMHTYIYICIYLRRQILTVPQCMVRCTWNIYKNISYIRSQKTSVSYMKQKYYRQYFAVCQALLTKTEKQKELFFWKFKNLPLKNFWIKREKQIRNKKDIMK